jgi:hypothetical protein
LEYHPDWPDLEGLSEDGDLNPVEAFKNASRNNALQRAKAAITMLIGEEGYKKEIAPFEERDGGFVSMFYEKPTAIRLSFVALVVGMVNGWDQTLAEMDPEDRRDLVRNARAHLARTALGRDASEIMRRPSPLDIN